MQSRSTKQKEIVLNTLKESKEHPSIYELYDTIKEKYPTLGKATVYRNVSKMLDDNLIRRIRTADGVDHYDGNMTPHIHLQCTSCNQIIDIFENDFEVITEKLVKKINIEVYSYELLLIGNCEKCLKNKQRKKEK